MFNNELKYFSFKLFYRFKTRIYYLLINKKNSFYLDFFFN